jgi:hypothetical protein
MNLYGCCAQQEAQQAADDSDGELSHTLVLKLWGCVLNVARHTRACGFTAARTRDSLPNPEPSRGDDGAHSRFGESKEITLRQKFRLASPRYRLRLGNES